VRTPFSPALVPLATTWSRGAVKAAPAGFALDGAMLWWWCAAAGRADPHGYLLPLSPSDPQVWPAVGAALAGAGLPGTLLGPRGDGPAYRIVGVRRLDRLAELVGDPPEGCPRGHWPG
jgi:hypothetical protein